MTNANQDILDQTLRLLFRAKSLLESCKGTTPQIEEERVNLINEMRGEQCPT